MVSRRHHGRQAIIGGGVACGRARREMRRAYAMSARAAGVHRVPVARPNRAQP